MTILIAGGAGFIGYHLCKRYLEQGWRVIILDNLLTGSMEHVVALSPHKHLVFIKGDVSDDVWLKDERLVGVDRIIHLACPASPVQYMRDPVHTLKSNFLGTLHLLELAKREQASFLLASTSEIYGDPEQHPQCESYWGNTNTMGPRACYDEGKRVAESLCYAFHTKHQVKATIARIFNTYGPHMQPHDGRVIGNMMLSALQGQPMVIHGTGKQTRSFCYVDDLVEGLMRLLENPKARGMAVNLGNPEEISMLELARMVQELAGVKNEFTFCAARQDDPAKRCPSIQRARDLLGWAPQISLQEGLQRMFAYEKARLTRKEQDEGEII